MTIRRGHAQGGMLSDAGRAAYWRLQWESATGALADLIAEHRELVDALRDAAADPEEDGYHDTDVTALRVTARRVEEEEPGAARVLYAVADLLADRPIE